MKRAKYARLIAVVCLCILSACSESRVMESPHIIPVPKEMCLGKGYFCLSAESKFSCPSGKETGMLSDDLNCLLREKAGYILPQKNGKTSGSICFALDTAMNLSPEGYCLKITTGHIEVKAAKTAGLFYGLQTLKQLLWDTNYYDSGRKSWYLPVLEIRDEPAFVYRGMHLDVSRHFFPVDFIKKYLDLMSFYKMNTFHWHLTDAGGWRLQIRKYPELTRKGAWRTREDWRKWWNEGERTFAEEGDAGAYGGYYTQDEIRDVVAYATARHIQVIPEIEMPGHSEEVFAAYPQFRCAGKKGKNGEYCAGKEETFGFIEDVLTEVMELFPSDYIHIGGDEASKAAWKKCPDCQRRTKQEHLKDEKELQSYFIKRVERFVRSKGRKIIGWDEILEGGLAPEAMVMSWRGEKGGIEAAKSGHSVIMTPGAYCYFDAYQAEPATQPYAIGGFLPYLKVYSYHPIPEVLSAEEAKYVLGAQANLWTEYISTPEHVEYMVFPRLLALSEVVWSPEDRKDQEDFKRRVATHIGWLQQKGVNVFLLSNRIDMETEVDTVNKRIRVGFFTEKYRPEIRYTTDRKQPDQHSPLYEGPFYIQDSAFVSAALFVNGERMEPVSTARFDYHKGIGKQVIYHNNYSASYPAAGFATLTDGYRGGLTYNDGRWQGFLKDVDVTIDLGENTELHFVSAKFMQLIGPGVYMPHYVKFSVSEDGKRFQEIGRMENDIPSDQFDLFFKDFEARVQANGRYVKVYAPKQRGFLFLDEVVIY